MSHSKLTDFSFQRVPCLDGVKDRESLGAVSYGEKVKVSHSKLTDFYLERVQSSTHPKREEVLGAVGNLPFSLHLALCSIFGLCVFDFGW